MKQLADRDDGIVGRNGAMAVHCAIAERDDHARVARLQLVRLLHDLFGLADPIVRPVEVRERQPCAGRLLIGADRLFEDPLRRGGTAE